MNNLSNYIQTAWLNTLRQIPYTPPTYTYLGLFTVAPTQAGGGTEFFAADYQRQAVSWNAPSALGTGMQITNSNSVQFPTTGVAANNWGTAIAAAVFDLQVGGNMLFFGSFGTGITVNVGGYALFVPNSLVFSLD